MSVFYSFRKIFYSFIILYCLASNSFLIYAYDDDTYSEYINYGNDNYTGVFGYLIGYLNLNPHSIDSKPYFVAKKNWTDLHLVNVKQIISYLESRIGVENTKSVLRRGLSNLVIMNYEHFINLVNFYERNLLGVDGVTERLKQSLTGFTVLVSLEGENSVENVFNLLGSYLDKESLRNRLLENLSFLQDLGYGDLKGLLDYFDSIGGHQYTVNILLKNFSLLNQGSAAKIKYLIQLLQSKGYIPYGEISEEVRGIIGYLVKTNSSRLAEVLAIYETYLDKEFIFEEVLKNFAALSETTAERIEQNIEMFKKYSNYSRTIKFEEIFKKYYKEFSLALPDELEKVLENLIVSRNYFNRQTIKTFLKNNYSILTKARWDKLKVVLQIFESYFNKDQMYQMLNKENALYYFITVDAKNLSTLTRFLSTFLGKSFTSTIIHSQSGVDFLYKMDADTFKRMVSKILIKYWDVRHIAYIVHNFHSSFLKLHKKNLTVIDKNLSVLYEQYENGNGFKKDGLQAIFEKDEFIEDIVVMDVSLEEIIHKVAILAGKQDSEIQNWVLENIDVFIKLLNSKNYKNFISNIEKVEQNNLSVSLKNILVLARMDSNKLGILLRYLDLDEIGNNIDSYLTRSNLEINDIFSFFEKNFSNLIDKKILFGIVNKYFKNIVSSDFKYLKNFIRSLLKINSEIVVKNIELILDPSDIIYNNGADTPNIDPFKILSILKIYFTKREISLILKDNFDILYKDSKNIEESIQYINELFKGTNIPTKMVREALFTLLNISTDNLKEMIDNLLNIGIGVKDLVHFLKHFSSFSEVGISSFLDGIKSGSINLDDLSTLIEKKEYYISIFNNNLPVVAVFVLKQASELRCKSLFDKEN